MSKYIPQAAVLRESVQQQKRIQHGLKTGEYVRYPDADKGPFVIKRTRFLNLDELTVTRMKEQGRAILARFAPKAEEPTEPTGTVAP